MQDASIVHKYQYCLANMNAVNVIAGVIVIVMVIFGMSFALTYFSQIDTWWSMGMFAVSWIFGVIMILLTIGLITRSDEED